MKLLGAVGLATILLLSGCQSKQSAMVIAAPPTIQAGKLTACTDMPYEPFEFREGAVDKGIDVDLIKAIASTMNLQAEFNDVPFDSIFENLDTKKCDLVASSVSITGDRQAKYAFSDGYFEVNQSLLVRSADKGEFNSLAALSGHKIGVQKGTTGSSYVASHLPGQAPVEYEDVGEMVDALKSGQLDGIVQDFPINSYVSQQSPELHVVQTFTDVEREQYGFAMQQDATQLRDAVNSSLRELRSNGEYDKILVRYLGTAG